MKMRNVETITHTGLSLKLFVWYIITKTVRFYNYIQFWQASITRNITLVNWFPSLNFRHLLESKGCLKFIQRFPWIDFHRFRYQWINITWLPNDFYRFPFLSIGYSAIYTELHRRYFERAAGLNHEKLGAYKPEDDLFLNLVLKREDKIFQIFLKEFFKKW